MIAKLRTVKVAPDDVEQGVQYLRDRMLPLAREIDGFRGMVGLVDRATGKAVTITLWDDVQALEASEAGGAQLRAAGGAPRSDASVERFEVIVHELPTMAS